MKETREAKGSKSEGVKDSRIQRSEGVEDSRSQRSEGVEDSRSQGFKWFSWNIFQNKRGKGLRG